MKLNEKSKTELRKLIEEELKNVPESQRINLNKELLEELLFETTTKDVKIPIWNGSFLSKIDLSEISFENVDFFRDKHVNFSNTNATIDLNIICNPGLVYRVDFSNSKIIGKLKQSYFSNLSNCGLTAFNLNMYQKGYETDFTKNCLEGFYIVSIEQLFAKPDMLYCSDFKDTRATIEKNVWEKLFKLFEKNPFKYPEFMINDLKSRIEGCVYNETYVGKNKNSISNEDLDQDILNSVKDNIKTQIKQLKK